jgi:hypothetical protein
MKTKYLTLLSLWCIFTVNTKCQTNFSGAWNYSNDYLSFTLDLTQNGNLITGNHCAVADSANIIDCHNPEDDDKTISGVINGDSILVTFKSEYCLKQGTAIIKKITANRIQWFITKEPDGLSYLPDSVVLDKYNDTGQNLYTLAAGSFSMQSGFSNITNSITNYGTYASFYIAYFPNPSMVVGTKYLVANVSENCWPSIQRTMIYSTGGRTWSIIIDINGDVYFTIVSGTPVIGGVGFGTLTYNL